MFNLEIKRISLKSLVFSAYPLVVFVFILLSSYFELGDLIDPEAGFFATATQVMLFSLIRTAVIVLFSVLAAFLYNLLSSFGMKGVRISLTEVEEASAQEETTEEETSGEDDIPMGDF